MQQNDQLRFVVDTNLLISAALIRGSSTDKALRLIEGLGILVFSAETFIELASVFMRDKFNRYINPQERQTYLTAYKTNSLFVCPDKHYSICRDNKDNKFLDVAVAGKAHALITGDQDLLVLKTIENIPILKINDFFGWIEK